MSIYRACIGVYYGTQLMRLFSLSTTWSGSLILDSKLLGVLCFEVNVQCWSWTFYFANKSQVPSHDIGIGLVTSIKILIMICAEFMHKIKILRISLIYLTIRDH